ncbi:hypothetical protein G7Y89_g4316 [Cudoniella acicularis]|uniref:Laccase n=1 Tax=Cudoniella acicularis TaxID=354080 RepID=A0A8H4W6U1_9HELO|nr:hypothetical protein G7Y89_g4316 [Cudoniella acicularis]
MFGFKLFLLLQGVVSALCATLTYNWDIDWVPVSPDGFPRVAVGINGKWPCPQIDVNVGDRVIVNIVNNLGNETTTIHFHGIFQTGSNQMDGPAQATQCPIAPGSSFQYDFVINQTGTYWYHAHVGGQYIDGLRGPIIVHDPRSPFLGLYEEEVTFTVTDWYHTQAPYLIDFFESPLNNEIHGGSEPVPNATLINEAQNVKFPIKPNGTYLFHIINMAAFAGIYVQFDQHELTVVGIDGVYTTPRKVSQVFLATAQRYSVIVQAKPNANQNFAITTSMDLSMFDPSVTPPNLNNNATAWLVYDSAKPLPVAPSFQYLDSALNDKVFTPYDQEGPLGPVTHPISLTMGFTSNEANQNRAIFNNVTYIPQKVPSLYTALSAPADQVSNPVIYGVNSNAFVLPYNAIVEITLSNTDNGPHPFHLHSHQFQVIARSDPTADDTLLTPPTNVVPPATPMRRDTVLVNGGGYVILRFKADNPGVALFHCHIEWHVEAGLTATFIEAPEQLQALGLVIPQSHKATCAKLGIPITGNAAGNTKNWTDLTGAFTTPPLNDWGALVNPPSSKGKYRYARRRSSRVIRDLE